MGEIIFSSCLSNQNNSALRNLFAFFFFVKENKIKAVVNFSIANDSKSSLFERMTDLMKMLLYIPGTSR